MLCVGLLFPQLQNTSLFCEKVINVMFTQKLDFSLAAAPMFLVVADSKDETQQIHFQSHFIL